MSFQSIIPVYRRDILREGSQFVQSIGWGSPILFDVNTNNEGISHLPESNCVVSTTTFRPSSRLEERLFSEDKQLSLLTFKHYFCIIQTLSIIAGAALMLVNERKNKILDYIAEHGTIRIQEM